MTKETDFIISELKKKGYPLENYVQGLLVSKGWHVQPNAYFLDKDTDKGRELDIKAMYETDKNVKTLFELNLLIQCKKLPGNAWIFFSVPQKASVPTQISRSAIADYLDGSHRYTYEIFNETKTHFCQGEVLATNYCEIVLNEEKSNKRNNNIWQSVITLIKATSQEVEDGNKDNIQYLEELVSFDAFKQHLFEIISIHYPLIVFEGNMYEAKFSGEEIELHKRNYVKLSVDYHSGRYKGVFTIDVITKEEFSKYLESIMQDIEIFDNRRNEISEYEKDLLVMVHEYYQTKEQEAEESLQGS